MYEPFTVFTRATRKKKNGKTVFVFYCMFRSEDGRRMTPVSTGQTSKPAARQWAREQMARGIAGRDMTLGAYVEAGHWWVWGECEYTKAKQAPGQNISHHYCDTRKSYLDHHVLPEFKDVKLSRITPAMIEKWQFSILDEGFNPGTVNRITGPAFLLTLTREGAQLKLNHRLL